MGIETQALPTIACRLMKTPATVLYCKIEIEISSETVSTGPMLNPSSKLVSASAKNLSIMLISLSISKTKSINRHFKTATIKTQTHCWKLMKKN